VILSFDIDGVVAATTDADFSPDRIAAEYYSKPVHNLLDLNILNRLIAQHDVYFITARSFKGATRSTRNWLASVGVNVEDCQGVICAEGCEGHGSDTKHRVINWVGSQLHIDDHSEVIKKIGEKGVLFYNPNYEPNKIAYYKPDQPYRTATHWNQIADIVKEVGG